MAGGLINIVAYGTKDLYLTGSPQITFFKIVYRRHTNFSKESYEIDLGNFNFGSEINIDVPKIADLFSNTYLKLEIPSIHFLKTDTCYNLSTDEISILNNIIPNGIIIDTNTSNIELTTINNLLDTYNVVKITINQFCEAYRTSINQRNIITQSVDDYINTIKESVIISNEDIIVYDELLNDALDFEHSKNIKKYDVILNPKMSNVGRILNTITSSYTIDSINYLIDSAIEMSVKVSKYFFGLAKRKKEIELENSSTYSKFAWAERLGHTIINHIDVNIGGERIDRHYGDWINIWYELTSNINQDELYNKLIGNEHKNITFDRNEKENIILNIPLSFWFCKKMGLAFPLIALQYSNISFTIKLNSFEKCAYIEKFNRYKYTSDNEWLEISQLSLSDIWDNMGLKMSGSLLIEYVFLDIVERRRFAQSAHEYLIEVVDQMDINTITNNKNIIKLDFEGPCKELIWIAQKTEYINDNSFYIKRNFNYGLNINGSGNPINNSKLLLNGYSRFEHLDKMFFNILQPHGHHNRSPVDGVNVYCIGLYPEEHQPSSTCNFSKIGDPTLVLDIDKSMLMYKLSDIDPNIIIGSENDITLETSINIRIYSHRYNILRVIGGNAGFAYNYS